MKKLNDLSQLRTLKEDMQSKEWEHYKFTKDFFDEDVEKPPVNNSCSKSIEPFIPPLDDFLLEYQESRLEDAYNQFIKYYGYDPRDSGDKLEANSWDLSEVEITFNYCEITPHDNPYSVSLEVEFKKLQEILTKKYNLK